MDRSPRWLWLLPPFLLSVQAMVLGEWLVDDAGITFAYARSLAEGHGFVMQPGAAPVEGVTNLLWTLLFALAIELGAFVLPWTPKLLGLACAASAMWIVAGGLGRERRWVFVSMCVVATVPAFAIWVASGLENGLTALACALVYRTLETSMRRASEPRAGDLLAFGGAVAFAFHVRPDLGFLGIAMPAAAWCRGLGIRASLVMSTVSAAWLAVLVAPVTIWRWSAFDALLPNTYVAKAPTESVSGVLFEALLVLAALLLLGRPWRGISRWGRVVVVVAVVAVVEVSRLDAALRSIAKPLGIPIFIAVAWSMSGGRRVPPALGGMAFATAAYFCLMPRDWMGEYRFATPFVLFAVPAACSAVATDFRAVCRSRILQVLLVACVLVVATKHVLRIREFAASPTVEFDVVLREFQRRHVRWLEVLDSERRHVAVPDLGGALWDGSVRLLDVAGLCSVEVARALGNRPAVAEIILRERPVVVSVHGAHAWWSGLHDDARFARDYVPIESWTDAWILREHGRRLPSGHFVRVDALRAAGLTVDELRARARDG